MAKHKPQTAYSISLPFGETLDVLASANAWWMDRIALDKLIVALKIDCSLVQACAFAGITTRQYKYFISLHHKFKEAVRGYQMLPSMEAHMTIMSAIRGGDLKTARWYLARKLPDEYGSPSRKMKTLRRQEIQDAAIQQQEHARLLMDPEVLELNREYEKRLKELVTKKIKQKSVTA